MKKYNWIISTFVFISITFLIIYLIRFDYIALSHLEFNYLYLAFSLFFLWSGFMLSALSWQKALNIHRIRASFNEALYSHGIAVFGKYLPGKIWVILGRASYFSKKGNTMLSTSTISLKEQLVYLILGLIISLIALTILPVDIIYNVVVLLTVIGLGFFIFSKNVHNLILSILKKVLKKDLTIPFVGIKEIKPYLLINVLLWLSWSFAFYLLGKSITNEIQFIGGFAFPIGVCYGLIVIFTPGGIGVREGILTLFLISSGVEASIAASISIISRLWFISGELFIFVVALTQKRVLSKKYKKLH